jgi:hypothetical protein
MGRSSTWTCAAPSPAGGSKGRGLGGGTPHDVLGGPVRKGCPRIGSYVGLCPPNKQTATTLLSLEVLVWTQARIVGVTRIMSSQRLQAQTLPLWIGTAVLLCCLANGDVASPQATTALINGSVRDKSTRQPVSGAFVVLRAISKDYRTPLEPFSATVKTDSRGRFAFREGSPALFSGSKFILVVCADGYLAYPQAAADLCAGGRGPFLKRFSSIGAFEKSVGIFSLAAGQIVRVEVELERGGSLKGRALINSFGVVAPCSAVSVVKRRDSSESHLAATELETLVKGDDCDTSGNFEFHNLPSSSNYDLTFPHPNYISDVIEGVQIVQGQSITIDRTFVHNDPTGIQGTMTVDGVPVASGQVNLRRLPLEPSPPPSHFCGADVQPNGTYACRGISSGQYKVEFVTDIFLPETEQALQSEQVVSVDPGKTITLDVDIPSPSR